MAKKEKKTGKKVYPSKKTLNLCAKEKPQINPLTAIPLVLLVLLVAALFAKFAVIDRIDRMNEANFRISAAEKRLADLTEATKDYDAVSLEYAKYSTSWMTDNERNRVLRTDMIALINEELMGENSSVRSIRLSNNQFSVELNNTDLQSTAKLVEQLQTRDDVAGVSVYTAQSQNGKDNIVSLVVTMKYEEKKEASK